ncbi:PAS domain S-box protein, partial [Candidatus Bipolaricaulota bacterium]|nr:PAS domain S-box protein [Candidatus Bipolaricaulota bacterium]
PKPISRADFKSSVTSALRVTQLAQDRRRLAEENKRYQEHLEEEVEKKAGALRESEEKYRAVVENASEAVFIAQDGVLPFANPSTSRLSGQSLEALRTRPFIEWVYPDDRPLVIDRYQRRLRGEDVPSEYEFRIVMPDGAIRWLELRTVGISWDGAPATLNFANDITDRKHREAEEESRQERMQQRDATLLQLAMDSILYQGSMQSAVQAITEASAQTLQIHRVGVWLYTQNKDAIECMDLYEMDKGSHTCGMVMKREDYPIYFQAIAEQRVLAATDAHQDPRTSEFLESRLEPLHISSMLDASVRLEGELVGVVSHAHVGPPRAWDASDINFASSIANLLALALEAINKRQAEEEREQSEIRYRSLFEGSPISLWQEDFSATKAFLVDLKENGVADLAIHLRNHPADLDEAIRRIRVEDVNAATLRLHGAPSKEAVLAGLDPILTDESRTNFIDQMVAVADGKTFFEGTTVDKTLDGQDLQIDLRWIAAHGYEESLERVLVSKVDITAIVEAEKSLQQALDGTIRAIGMTTETRDPYTAGHQRRATQLALAIANRLGLDEATCEGTRVAGLMHDIGKLAVPAEILSKPSILSDMEMSLIQSHPQVAYDILQTVVFPWPIADIVLQHHEQIDGSGYPRGLHKEDILIEARILAVADTVEAMASHRPYRPALGIERALAEISEKRGKKFDAQVVDACLFLFREGGFTFQDPLT